MRFALLPTRAGRASGLLTAAILLAVWGASGPVSARASAGGALVEGALSSAPADARERALGLLRERDFEAAYRSYMDLLRDYPLDDEVNYGLAYAALGTERYPHALLAFERLSDRYPADAALRLRLAETHVRLGDAVAARRELDTARRLQPGVETAAVERAVLALEHAHTLWTWNARLGTGLVYDSNANLGPASEYMTLGAWADLYVEGIKGMSSWGRYVSASADVARRAADGSPWRFVGDAALYKRWNGNPDLISDREFGWGRLALGVSYTGRRFLVDLRVKSDLADQGKGRHVRGLGPELTLVWVARPRAQLISRAAWERRDYRHDRPHNGSYWWMGQSVRLLIGNAPHEVTVGVRALRGCPSRAAYGYTGWEGTLNVLFRLPYRLELSPFVSYRRTLYAGAATALESARRSDSLRQAGVALGRELVPGLRGELAWRYALGDSSSPLYRYGQHTVTMGLTWTFR